MSMLTDNETWVIETGGMVFRKETRGGVACLSPFRDACLLSLGADYGMRNAGDLDTAADAYPEFQLNARRIAKASSLRLTHETFSLPKSDLEQQYFDRFEQVCSEIREGGSQASSGV